MNNYRIIIKCQAGFFTIVDKKSTNPYQCLISFRIGAVHTIEEKHGDNYFTVFALKGPRVCIASIDIYESNIIQNYYPKTKMNSINKPVTENV